MVNKPKDFDTTQGYEEFGALPAGGYVCRIMNVEETVSQSGRDMLKISLDIAEGEYKDRFATMYRTDYRLDKKWGCIAYQLIYDPTDNASTNRGFKSFCTAAEKSNRGFTIQWGNNFAACFKNKIVGVIFRREQYIGNDNAAHWSTKPVSFRNADKIRKGDFGVPGDKPLANQPAPAYSGYPAAGTAGVTAAVPAYAADPFAPSQNVQPAAAQAQQVQQAQHTQPMNVPGLGDFEEIISDSDLSF